MWHESDEDALFRYLDKRREKKYNIIVILWGKPSNCFGQYVGFILGWYVNGVKVSSDASYTFTVAEGIALEARYKNAGPGGEQPGGEQPEKTGLFGGAIAGIAVGSVAVAGLGGFSLFWFVIKKKKFADLIALFKKK